MSDVGLGAVLDLNIADALRRIDQLGASLNTAMAARVVVDTTGVAPEITAAVDAADTAVAVTSDAAEVTGSIDAAVENADTGVVITGEAAEITGDIDAAVENADTHVIVTGEASSVTGAVDEALAERSPFGPVTVDGEVSEGLNTGIANLSANLADASDEGRIFGAILAGLSVGAAVAGLRALGDAASDLQESTTKAQVVFGQQFGQIEAFGKEAAQATGLAKQSALEAAGTFGNLFQALGSSREEASKLAPEVVQLGADLASFNNIGVDEALEKLRSGLVGEIEPLRSLGISFLAADVQAKALEIGLGDLNGNLTEGEKVQARYALIVEQTTFAQGDFARTSEGLANQQRILSAELGNAAAAAGQDLLPAFLAIVAEIRESIPGLEQLAGSVLPALADSLVALSPLIGTTVDLLIALSPIVVVIADTISLIPAPVIQAAAALITFNRAMSLLGTGIGPLVTNMRTMLQITSAVAASRGVSTFSAGVGALSGQAGGLATTMRGLTTGISGATAAAGAGFVAFTLYQDMMASARAEGEAFGASLRESFDPSTASLGELRDASEQLGEKINQLKGDVDDSFLGRNTVNRDFNAALGEGVEQAEAFRAEIDATAAALEQTNIREGFEAQFGGVVDAIVSASDALGHLGQTAPEAVSAIQGLRLSGQGTDRQILNMALSLGAADLSSEEMADSATALGLDVEDLGSLITDTTGALDAFVSSAVAGLPTVQGVFASTLGAAQEAAQDTAEGIREAAQARADAIRETTRDALTDSAGDFSLLTSGQRAAIGEAAESNAEAIVAAAETEAAAVEEGAQVTAEAFTRSLLVSTAELADFRADLEALTSAGFSDVAGLLAQTGLEEGNALADELAAALEAGNTTIIENLSAANTAFQTETQTTVAYMRDVLGPELILQSGLIGESSAAALFEGIDFSERIRIQGALANTTLSEQGKALAVVAAIEGEETARAYGASLDLDQETIDEAVKAGVAIKNSAPTDAAREAGRLTGLAFGNGITTGMTARQSQIEDKASQLVLQARAAAARSAREGSPSKLFATLGESMALGVVQGLEQANAQVIDAAERIVREAASAVATVAPDVTAQLAAGAGPGAGAGVPDSLVRALESIAATGPGDATQIGPFFGGDVRGSLREATVELQAIRRRRR